MNVSVERLRVWLLVGAGLLVMVIAAFLGYAHYRAHRFLTNLPKKLGVNVRRETNGFTYSQSVQGRTIYTVHAAKAVERADGKVTLHDVGIVLYGRKEDRADRIYGKEFEYDQKNGVIRAEGEVHIDLQAPEASDANAKMDYAAGKDLHGGKAEEKKDVRLIHVTTSGLVFLQKLGIAATDNEIEFESGGLTGHAVGADYNSDTGVVVLHSAVKVNGLERDRPVVLTASRAELDRQNERALLTQAKYVAVGGKSGAGETVQGKNVVVHLRPDGTVQRLEAEGDVTLTNGTSGTMVAPRGEMTLNAQSQPQSAVMLGGVRYSTDEPLRQAKGEAKEGRAAFDKVGRPEHVVMIGAVHLHEKVRASEAAGEAWSERELNAGQVELSLAAEGAEKAQIRDAKATGDARLKVMDPALKGGGATSSALGGDVLTAHFVRVGNADHLSELHGDGHTSMRRVNAKGVVETSSGDSLLAHFRPVTAGVTHKGQGADEIANATERGHVVMTELPVKKPGDSAAPTEERVTAERAVYDGELERTTLTGNVQASDGSNVLWADRVISEQQTGDATADGSVKASFRQPGSTDEPVHVLASRAELKHDSQVAKFYGSGSSPARLWQGASQVDAPVIEFEQKQKRLLAHGEGQGAPGAVHTVLVSGLNPKADAASPAKTGKQIAGGKASVVRVISRDLVYSDEVRRADFTGGIQVDSAEGSMRGQQAVVYLQAAVTNGAKKAVAAGGFMGGSVERVVASGHIEIQQPGRRASGEQVVYTASDGMFVLTGTAAALPKVVDDQQGTVTGTSLRFHAGDENVVVSNEGESGAGQRVRTETRVKNKQ
ncbi:LptA/OstA family protein [Granulicella sp. S190]|uniref:LptA/OstA family protein n=1 Tax=Granulicella sp. S190 TaxID=1747226 RepID=UPI00131C817C|nr:LptA/OstA family protein [Granulicella sp. S190]